MSLEDLLTRIRNSPMPSNEESAKFQIIAPILRNLGWDPEDASEVMFEHNAGGKGGGRIDIALAAGGKVAALIEAKKPGEKLSDHVSQVLIYAFHEGVDICALTTGIEWWLFLPRESGKPLARRFMVLDLMKTPIEQIVEDFESFLHKDKLTSGEAEAKAKRVLRAITEGKRLEAALARIWQDILVPDDDELVELVTKRIYKQVSIRPSREQVEAALRRSAIPPYRLPPECPSISEPVHDKVKQRRNPSNSKKPREIILLGTRYPVRNNKAILVRVMEHLHGRDPSVLFDGMNLTGKKWPYVTTLPHDKRRYFPLASTNFYIFCNLSGKDLQLRAVEFLKLFGHEESDLEVIFAE